MAPCFINPLLRSKLANTLIEKTKMGNTKTNRRNFLKGGLAGLGLSAMNFDNLLNMISKSVLSDLMANEPNNNSHINYVGINLHGGPSRWLWDLPLHVTGGRNNLHYNQNVITKFNNAGAEQLGVYDCVEKFNVMLPSIWDSNIYDGSSWAGMDQLAQNSIFIRGVELPNGAHEGFWHNVITSVGSPGIHTFPQLQSNYDRPLDCVQLSPSASGAYPYNPKADGSSFNILFQNNVNPMAKILSPFNFNRSTLQSPVGDNSLPRGFDNGNLTPGEVDVRNRINFALEQLKIMANEINQKSGKLFLDHQRAKEQFTRLTESLLTEFQTRKEFYQGVISQNIRPPVGEMIPQVEGVHTSRGGDDQILYQYYKNKYIKAGTGLDSLFANAHINSMAGSMAMIEILLKNNLTCSVITGIGSMDGLNGINSENKNVSFKLNNDSHFIGAALSLIGFSKYYRCLSGCLKALKDYLSTYGLWDKTILHIHGDFNRFPRPSGGGTDHGPGGSNITLMSGLIDQCHVIGGTYIQCPEVLRYDWGIATDFNFPHSDSKPFSNENIEKSFADIFNTSSSAPNARAIFEIKNGKLVPTNLVQNSARNTLFPQDED